jgi:YVTN family beta-propeller protein
MIEEQIDALFARYVEHLVVNGSHLDVDELAAGDADVAAGLRQRIRAFRRIDEALGRRQEPLTGRTLGRYQIHEKLGAGGMGEVYRAHDLDLGRDVAVKSLPAVFALDPERRARFEREARLLASIDHPNIAVIHDLERIEGVAFLVLELVPGETLAERIERGPLVPGEALPLFEQIARALEVAHSKGIVHRDLKPANIMITPDGWVKVLDFGLGKIFGGQVPGDLGGAHDLSVEGTVTGLVLGTAHYMSPEQARGEEVNRQTDVWSFGCVMYEALAGRTAFPGVNFLETVAAILDREPDWSSLPSSTPASVMTLLRRCLEKNADRRLHDIADARIEIEDALQPGSARPFRVGSFKRSAILLLGALLVAVIAGFTWSPWQSGSHPGRAGQEQSGSEPSLWMTGPYETLEDYQTHLWEANRRWLETLQAEQGAPLDDPPYVVAVSTRRPPTLQLIDGSTHAVIGRVLLSSKSSGDFIGSNTVSSDGALVYVVNAHQDSVRLVDTVLKTRSPAADGLAIQVPGDPHWISSSPDGDLAYVSSTDGYVSVVDIDPESSSYHRLLPVPGGDAIVVGRSPRQMAFTPDGSRMYVTNKLSDSVSVVDVDPQSVTYHRVLPVPGGSSIPVGTEPECLAATADGQRVYVTNMLSETVSVIDADPASSAYHTVVATISVQGMPLGVATTPDGSRVYVVARDSHSVAVIDTASQQLLPIRIPVRETPGYLVIDPMGRRTYVSNRNSRDISVIDTDPGSSTFHMVVATIPVEGMPSFLSIGPPLPESG